MMVMSLFVNIVIKRLAVSTSLDQAASIETHALRNFVETVRVIPKILGTGKKNISSAEAAVRKKLRIDVPTEMNIYHG